MQHVMPGQGEGGSGEEEEETTTTAMTIEAQEGEEKPFEGAAPEVDAVPSVVLDTADASPHAAGSTQQTSAAQVAPPLSSPAATLDLPAAAAEAPPQEVPSSLLSTPAETEEAAAAADAAGGATPAPAASVPPAEQSTPAAAGTTAAPASPSTSSSSSTSSASSSSSSSSVSNKPPRGSEVFVGGLGKDVNEADLYSAFASVGEIFEVCATPHAPPSQPTFLTRARARLSVECVRFG
jgi:hypothetical protein